MDIDRQDAARRVEAYRQLDADLREWSKLTRAQLKRHLLKTGVHERTQRKYLLDRDPPLYPSVKATVRKRRGNPESVSFSFSRHGVFREHGVGKDRKKGTPAAKKAARPWLSLVLPHRIEELADLLAERYGDIAVSDLRIIVPGLMTTRISGKNG